MSELKSMRSVELLIRQNALKDVEIWLNQQYLEIAKELKTLEDDPAIMDEGYTGEQERG